MRHASPGPAARVHCPHQHTQAVHISGTADDALTKRLWWLVREGAVGLGGDTACDVERTGQAKVCRMFVIQKV